jgi:integrase
MASFERRAGAWRVKVRIKGVSKSATFDTKAQAAAWALQQEAEVKTVAAGGMPSRTVQQALARFAEEVSPGRKGERWEVLRLRAMGEQLPAKRIADLTPDDLGRWRDARLSGDGGRKVAASTFNRELNLLSAVLEHARREWRWIAVNPARDVKRPSNPPHRQTLISDAHRDRLLLALGHSAETPQTLMQQVAVLLQLALETGMRSGEMVGLTWDAVHARHVSLPKTKNGSARDVPLSTRAVALIKQMRGVDPVKVFTVTDESRDALFRKARDRAQLRDLTFHDARHTAVTRLAGVLDVMTLARMIGHKDVRSLMIYFNPTADSVAARLG